MLVNMPQFCLLICWSFKCNFGSVLLHSYYLLISNQFTVWRPATMASILRRKFSKTLDVLDDSRLEIFQLLIIEFSYVACLHKIYWTKVEKKLWYRFWYCCVSLALPRVHVEISMFWGYYIIFTELFSRKSSYPLSPGLTLACMHYFVPFSCFESDENPIEGQV